MLDLNSLFVQHSHQRIRAGVVRKPSSTHASIPFRESFQMFSCRSIGWCVVLGLISHTCGGYAAMPFKDPLDERIAPVIRNFGIRMCSSKWMEHGSCRSFAYTPDKLTCLLLALDPWMDGNLGGTHIRPRNDSVGLHIQQNTVNPNEIVHFKDTRVNDSWV